MGRHRFFCLASSRLALGLFLWFLCGAKEQCQSNRKDFSPMAATHWIKNAAVNFPWFSLFLIFGSESTTPIAARYSS